MEWDIIGNDGTHPYPKGGKVVGVEYPSVTLPDSAKETLGNRMIHIQSTAWEKVLRGLIKQETNCNAVLLLDDVLSELDSSRQRFLIESMKEIQVFITATEIDPEVRRLLPQGYEFHIEDGFAKMLT